VRTISRLCGGDVQCGLTDPIAGGQALAQIQQIDQSGGEGDD
jgi:hypothetical protein